MSSMPLPVANNENNDINNASSNNAGNNSSRNDMMLSAANFSNSMLQHPQQHQLHSRNSELSMLPVNVHQEGRVSVETNIPVMQNLHPVHIPFQQATDQGLHVMEMEQTHYQHQKFHPIHQPVQNEFPHSAVPAYPSHQDEARMMGDASHPIQPLHPQAQAPTQHFLHAHHKNGNLSLFENYVGNGPIHPTSNGATGVMGEVPLKNENISSLDPKASKISSLRVEKVSKKPIMARTDGSDSDFEMDKDLTLLPQQPSKSRPTTSKQVHATWATGVTEWKFPTGIHNKFEFVAASLKCGIDAESIKDSEPLPFSQEELSPAKQAQKLRVSARMKQNKKTTNVPSKKRPTAGRKKKKKKFDYHQKIYHHKVHGVEFDSRYLDYASRDGSTKEEKLVWSISNNPKNDSTDLGQIHMVRIPDMLPRASKSSSRVGPMFQASIPLKVASGESNIDPGDGVG
jgi:hypothetical protein